MQCNIQVLPTKHGLRVRREHNRLRIVNHHCRALHHVPDLQFVQQEHGRGVHAPDAVEVDGVRRVGARWGERTAFGEGAQLGEDGGPEGVEGLADAADLCVRSTWKDEPRRRGVESLCERKVVKGATCGETHLHVIDDDVLRVQQEAELLLVRLLERIQEVLAPIAVAGGKDHERRVRPVEAHVEHPLDAHARARKALPLQVGADVRLELVEPLLERGAVLGGVVRGAGFLQLECAVACRESVTTPVVILCTTKRAYRSASARPYADRMELYRWIRTVEMPRM